MSIGTNIKKLRRERDLTQESLADYLGISVGAVSQWECDRTSPDISQLPMLANIFDVTTDEILGVDSTKNELKIKEIAKCANDFYGKADFDKAASILREGLREYPRSYFLMAKLAECTTDKEERVKLGEKVFTECPDTNLKYEAVTVLIYGYRMLGKPEQAVKYVEMMPAAWCSKEDLMMINNLGGETAFDNLRDYAKFCTERLFIIFHKLCEMKDEYSDDERIELCRQRIKIGEAVFCDGDFNYSADLMANAYSQLAHLYAERSDKENTLFCLRSEGEYRKMFDTYDTSAPNTSPALKGYIDGKWVRKDSENTVDILIEDMETDTCFDFIRDDKEYIKILDDLKSSISN